MSSDDSSDDNLDGPYYPERRQDVSGDRADSLIQAILEDCPEDVMTIINDHPEIIDIPGGPTECTALQAASMLGQMEIVRFLLEKEADVHSKGATNTPPIHYACLGGSTEVLMLLLSHGANVHDRDSRLNKTPLYVASQCGDVEIVLILLAHGAHPRDKDFPSFNPLHGACSAGQFEIVQILLDCGANLYDYDDKGRTALHVSCEGKTLLYDYSAGTVPMVSLLLENGADPNHPDKNGLYILDDLRCRVPVEESLFAGTITIVWEHQLRPLLEILLSYGAGAGLPCCSVDELHSKCNTTVLMCCFQTFRREAVRKQPLSKYWNYEEVRDSFEGHFIRVIAAGLNSSKDERPFEPPEKDLDWSLSRREAYRVQCEEELTLMKMKMIDGTSATYFDLLTRDLSVLMEQDYWGQLMGDGCTVRQFPVYGNMLHCSYLRTRRPVLLVKSLEFFAILSPSLLPDCAQVVMTYLPNADLDSLVALCKAYQTFMDRKSLETIN